MQPRQQQDDLQRATDLVRHMITRYGMGEALGLATFEGPRQPAHGRPGQRKEGKAMEFLQANWLWILLGLGAVWLLSRRGGMGCGMGGHGSHGSHGSRASEDEQESAHGHTSLTGRRSGEAQKREEETGPMMREREARTEPSES